MLGRIRFHAVRIPLNMRTSRVSRDASRLADALSSSRQGRTRSSNGSQTKKHPSPALVAPLPSDDIVQNDGPKTDSSDLSSPPTTDIEDLVGDAASRKRKRAASGATRASRSPKNGTAPESQPKKPSSRQRRLPARKSTAPDGSQTTEPPSNWEEIYSTVKDMRLRNPTAPVDTMGCAELYWRSSSPQERRFHTLIALMLSSQTKDTVTATAMQRLHTELSPEEQPNSLDGLSNGTKSEENERKLPIWDHTKQQKPSTLNVENILAVSPTRLNELIGAVGFHNNKTKYIKAAALILRDEYDSDIPSTPEGLMKLPGVGPKMAYLCMSSAWDKHEGIGVDVHVHRITNLWGWNKTKTPEETRKALESWLPKDKWHEINKLLVGLGQTVCLPVGRKCGECDLAGTGLCKGEIKGQAAKTKKNTKGGAIKVEKEDVVKVKTEDEDA